MSVEQLIIYFLIYSAIVVIGIVRYNNLTIPFRLLVLVIFIVALGEAAVDVLIRINKNGMPAYHISCVLQYIGFAFVYSKLITGRLKKYILISIIPFCIFSVLNTVYLQTFFKYNTNIIMLSYIIFIIFSLLLFMQMLNAPKDIAIFKQSVFWFNCAVLVYSILMPVCYGGLNYMMKHKLDSNLLYEFMVYFTFLYYIILGYAVYIDKKVGVPNQNGQVSLGS
jgi:hypothetical protein